ncbi:hypothetical protein ACGYK3_18605 [Sulfitobacter sp. 1A05707]|uniref:hypothetical protein n=1 Tax=Sulfitobacter sp. 1A05707 TaxID=3368560 RepID=UPI003744FD27
MPYSKKSNFKFFALQLAANKAAFFLMDLGYAFDIIPDARMLLQSQAVMLLFIPISLYFGPLAIQDRYWKAGFSVVCLSTIVASFVWVIRSGPAGENLLLPMSVSMVVFLICQNILLRFHSYALQLSLSTLHMAAQAVALLLLEAPVRLQASCAVGVAFTLTSLAFLTQITSAERWSMPFTRNWLVGLSLNGCRAALNFGIRMLIISSHYPWLLVAHRVANQLVSIGFTAIVGKGIDLPQVPPRQRFFTYVVLQIPGMAATLWWETPLFALFTLVICTTVEMAQSEGRYLAATKS